MQLKDLKKIVHNESFYSIFHKNTTMKIFLFFLVFTLYVRDSFTQL